MKGISMFYKRSFLMVFLSVALLASGCSDHKSENESLSQQLAQMRVAPLSDGFVWKSVVLGQDAGNANALNTESAALIKSLDDVEGMNFSNETDSQKLQVEVAALDAEAWGYADNLARRLGWQSLPDVSQVGQTDYQARLALFLEAIKNEEAGYRYQEIDLVKVDTKKLYTDLKVEFQDKTIYLMRIKKVN